MCKHESVQDILNELSIGELPADIRRRCPDCENTIKIKTNKSITLMD